MIPYPASLPVPVRDEYSRAVSAPASRLRMEDGFARPRRVVTSAQFAYTLRWNLRRNQVRVFDGWWARATGDGGEIVQIPIVPGRLTKVRLGSALPSYGLSGAEMVARVSVYSVEEAPSYAPGMPVWPAGLPYPERDDYAIQVGGVFDNIEPTTFQSPSRRRFSTVPATVTGTLKLSLAERDLFWEFYDRCGNGTRYFMGPVRDARGFFTTRCWMEAEPAESADGAGFSISISMGFVPRTVLKY